MSPEPPRPADVAVAALRRAISTLTPTDEREAASVSRILTELDRLPHPLDQDAGPIHVTGSAIVVGPRGVLLHRHKRMGIWLQPGGHIDHGETPWEAARRETTEETGIRAAHPDSGPRLVHVDVHAGPRGHTHLDVRYLLLAGDERPTPSPGESPAVCWFSWSRAVAVADAGLVGALRGLRP